ncbi:MAG: nucleotidyl transferase AbiEii/AbiGii toxin family protein [Hadesarchaea archaeon]|nr:nucleotidyl transferase AbiEii/AbiGii toxin family protein [Hadesarchaea archaeon]
MEKIPLYLRMRRERHRKVAVLQDMVVEALYRAFPRAVLHGGTAIWRCYSGNRFSEDLDVYLGSREGLENLFRELGEAGFRLLKRRTAPRALYSLMALGDAEVRLEATFKGVRWVMREYETCEGLLLNVLTLPPEEMIREKIAAYLARRRIRDLYDLSFMLRYAEKTEELKRELRRFLERFREPVDEGELKALILFGAVPTSGAILEHLRREVG